MKSVMVRVTPEGRERLRKLIAAVPGIRNYGDAVEVLSMTSTSRFLDLQREVAEANLEEETR